MRALLLYGAPRRDALADVSDAPRAESSDICNLKWLARAHEPRAAEKVVPSRMETLADIFRRVAAVPGHGASGHGDLGERRSRVPL
jgi:hypothetical protein